MAMAALMGGPSLQCKGEQCVAPSASSCRLLKLNCQRALITAS